MFLNPLLKKFILLYCFGLFFFFSPGLNLFFFFNSPHEFQWVSAGGGNREAHLDSIFRLWRNGKLKTSTFRAAQKADKARHGPTRTGADMSQSTDSVLVVTVEGRKLHSTIIEMSSNCREKSPKKFKFSSLSFFFFYSRRSKSLYRLEFYPDNLLI